MNLVAQFEIAINSITSQSYDLCVSLETTDNDWAKIDARLVRAQSTITLISNTVDYKNDTGAVTHSEMNEMVALYVDAMNTVMAQKASWERATLRIKISERISQI